MVLCCVISSAAGETSRYAKTLALAALCGFALSSISSAIPSARADDVIMPETAAHIETLETVSLESLPVQLAANETARDESTPPPVMLADSSASNPPAAGAPVKTEVNEGRLHKALRERGLALGYGQKLPFNRFDDHTDTTMVQVIPFKGRFRNATQEFIWEAPFVVFTRPDTDYLVGLTLMFRQHLTSNRRFAPYLEFGVGANLTNLNIREIGGRFQFSLQGGAGIRAALNRRTDLTVGARWYHLSNGGITRPNTGLNDYLITVGASRLF
jgi:opacity protein-like surface antigen